MKKRTIMDLDLNNPEDLEIALEMEKGRESFECRSMNLKGGKMNKTELPMLFAKDKNGRTKTWHVRTEDETIYVTTGLENGKKKVTETEAKPKNIGKASETTAISQAQKEAIAKWTKQKERKAYVENIEDYGKDFWTTLAKDFWKINHEKLFAGKRLFMSKKLDGVRAYFKDKMTMSRGNTIYKVKSEALYDQIAVFEETICNLLSVNEVVLDGEFYIENTPLQQIQRAVKSGEEVSPELVEFHIFDIYVPELKELTFEHRYDAIFSTFKSLRNIPGIIDKLDYVEVFEFTIEEIDKLYNYVDEVGKEGYEGAMIRIADSAYEVGNGSSRSDSLVKIKRFEDDEFEIIGVEEDKAFVTKDGEKILQGKFICVIEDGVTTFGVTPIGERTGLKNDLLLNPKKYIGELLKTKFKGRTDDNIPIHATGVCIRMLEDM